MNKTIYYCDLCGSEIKSEDIWQTNIVYKTCNVRNVLKEKYDNCSHGVDCCFQCCSEYKKLEMRFMQMTEDFLKEKGFFKEIKE